MKIQCTGFVVVKGEKILVLCREMDYLRMFKVRKSGRDGNEFADEADYLADNPDLLEQLKNGEVVAL